MSDLLDLGIHLTPPPADAPPGTLAGITLRCDELGLSHAGGRLAEVVTPTERAELRWYLEESPLWADEDSPTRARAAEDFLVTLGRRFYHAVLGGEAAGVVQPWRLQPAKRRQVSLRSEIPGLLGLPWELLHDEQGFLALRTRPPVAVVRCLPQSELPALRWEFVPPLRVLLVTARPEATPFIDHRLVAGPLVEVLTERGISPAEVTLEILRPPTRGALRDRLGDPARPPVHILHFDGHGLFEGDDADAEAAPWGEQDGVRRRGLAFEREDGQLDLAPPEDLAQVLQGSGVRLAVLTACRSAMGATADPFASIAAQLIRGGLDAVVGMGANLLADSARRFAESFYRAVANGVGVPEALGRARQALHDAPGRPVDGRGTPARPLRDWWVPQLFQLRPLEFQAERPASKGKRTSRTRATAPTSPALRSPVPRHGFVGRARELLRIERALVRGRVVVVHGPIGSGKTTLACEAANWLTRTGMYEGSCVVPFAAGGDAIMLRQALGGLLGVSGRAFDPSDPASALAALRKKAAGRPIVAVLDDVDVAMPGGPAPLESAALGALVDLMLALPDLGCGVVLTARHGSLGDARLAPGRRVVHVPLGGLEPLDALTLAGTILDALEIDRHSLPPRDLAVLLQSLDELPLAIVLVLPVLRGWHPVRLQGERRAALDRAAFTPTPGLSRPLSAALEVWHRALPESVRAGLARLAPPLDTPDEAAARDRAGLSDSDWSTLRVALESSGLLTVDRPEDASRPAFLRFHVALKLFLGRPAAGA